MPNRTLTQIPVTAADFHSFTVRQNPDSGELEVVWRYRVKTTAGEQIGPWREVVTLLTSAQRTTALSFVTNVGVPAANTQEGT
jgi:hypothetical protein